MIDDSIRHDVVIHTHTGWAVCTCGHTWIVVNGPFLTQVRCPYTIPAHPPYLQDVAGVQPKVDA